MPDSAEDIAPYPGNNAYVTLLTRPSYLAGAVLLAYTLHKHSPTTPLIITYTPDTLPEPAIKAFRQEAQHSNIILHAVEHLRLPDDGTEHGMVAERFIDTWTKLRVFDLHGEIGGTKWDRLCWLDADMMIFSNPSPLVFNKANDDYLASGDGLNLMAVHTCVCNLDHDAWAPKSWTPQNCALARLTNPTDIARVEASPATLSNFNSGTFLYRPTPSLAAFVQQNFKDMGTTRLKAMKFPDQDFLNAAFDNRWSSLSWRTNALKTWRYWHTNIWADDNLVAVLHYIVDKPWAARLNPDGSAGYLGKDGETHKWWWDEYGMWERERKEMGEEELLEAVGKYTASETGEVGEEMRAVGGGAQGWAKKWEGKRDGEGEVDDEKKSRDTTVEDQKEDQQESFGSGPNGPILRKPMLGERGHGPVARGRGFGGRGRGEGWSIMEN